jgi:hypothetical protein
MMICASCERQLAALMSRAELAAAAAEFTRNSWRKMPWYRRLLGRPWKRELIAAEARRLLQELMQNAQP